MPDTRMPDRAGSLPKHDVVPGPVCTDFRGGRLDTMLGSTLDLANSVTLYRMARM